MSDAEKAERVFVYGARTNFTVILNENGISEYPNKTGQPAIDRYICDLCGGEFTHTEDGIVYGRGFLKRSANDKMQEHMRFCPKRDDR